MKAILVSALVMSIVAIGSTGVVDAGDQTNVTPINPGTGVWWMSLSHVQKDIAAGGLMAGFQVGYDAGMGETLHYANLPQQQEESVNEKALGDKPDFSRRTVGAVVSTVDQIFNDHPEIRNQQVALFIMCAANGSDCAGAIKLAQSFAKLSK